MREYFAGVAMMGIMSGGYKLGDMFDEQPKGALGEAIADRAVGYADALIAELEKAK